MKKIISILILTLIIFNCIVIADEDDWYEAPKVPRLTFANVTEIPSVSAGDYLILELTIQNESLHTAKDIKVTPEIGELPIEWEKPTDYTKISSISRSKEKNITYKFKIKDSAKIDTYGLKFNFAYQNSLGEAFTSSQTIYFKVIQEKSNPVFVIDNIITEPETIIAGKPVTVSFTISNIGGLDAKTSYVSLSNLSKDTFMPANSVDSKYVDTIAAGESVRVSYDLLVSENIEKGTNELEVKIDYNSDGKDSSISRNIYLNNILSENEAPVSKEGGTPKVMISSYSTNPKNITAGDNFVFNFTFTNTNAVKAIRNIKITVSSDEGSFIIAKGSNTFFIESLGPKGSISKSIELIAKQDLTSKSYPVNLNFDFEDSAGNEYTSKEVISLPITEYSKLVINSVYVGEAYVDGTTNLSFDYINMGKATVSNLTASVEGDYSSVQSINYIGNLNAGTSDYYDIEVTPTKDGDNYGTLVLSFEDSSGKIIEVKKEFQGFAMSESQFSEEPFEPTFDYNVPVDQEQKTISAWILVGASLVSLLISFILTKTIVTKIYRKKLEDEI